MSTPFPFPGEPAIVDGSEAIASVENRLSEVACAYPITPSTTMAALFHAAVADGRTNLWGTPLRFVEPESEHSSASAAEGVALTPGRSLAVDTSLLPLGAPVWLDTHWPADPSRALRRLMVAQDTGSAIRGAVRGDFYWGTGAAAFAEAGRMKSAGRYWFLLPKAVAARIGPTS